MKKAATDMIQSFLSPYLKAVAQQVNSVKTHLAQLSLFISVIKIKNIYFPFSIEPKV